MTDKELLIAAARAAGVRISSHIGMRYDYFSDDATDKEWNPLKDDGDALRLAVMLNMNIHVSTTECLVTRGHTISECVQAFDGSATRRAIVCAAAEIGSLHNAVAQREP